MEYLIVSNNAFVKAKYQSLQFVEGDFHQVLIAARDRIHRGWRLVSHPLPASIRMMYSPIRSIILAKEPHSSATLLIEQSIDSYLRTMGQRQPDYRNLADYQTIDFELLQACIADLTTNIE